MKAKHLLKSLLYLGLLGGAILFVRQNIGEYIQGSTGYSTTHEPLTLNDLPSLVICWKVGRHGVPQKVKYGTDFTIDFKVIEEDIKTVTLNESKPVKTLLAIEVKVSELYLSKKHQMPCSSLWEDGQCFKIDTHPTGKSDVDVQGFRIQVALMFSDWAQAPSGQG